jgi:hypothetical protein
MMAGKAKKTYRHNRERGAAAVLAMMFLVIFSSLAAAMAIVSQGNLSTADSSLKINRSLAAAETGMRFMIYRMNQVTQGDPSASLPGIKIREGEISTSKATTVWDDVRTQLYDLLSVDSQYLSKTLIDNGLTLEIPEISLGAGQPSFRATFQPHPLGSPENYDDPIYQRPPYSDMNPPISEANPLDNRWVRVTVTASDGPVGSRIYRSVSIDFQIEKKIRFALLSKSRIMIGRNVMIEGPIGSSFLETNLDNGHPIQMESDFRGLEAALDADLDLFRNTLITNDADGDNRIAVASATETNLIGDPASFDYDQDGYIDDYDFFLAHFDSNADLKVSLAEIDPTSTAIDHRQLLTLIDTFGDPARQGYNDGFIDEYDRYAKIRGEVHIVADKAGWEDGAADPDGPGGADGAYQDYFQGPIHPDFGEDPLTFAADTDSVHEFEPSDFNVSYFKAMASNNFASQAGSPSSTVTEDVPYGAAYPYEYYDRPVYENITFDNVLIPKGTNALFRNCRFVGVTFIDTAVDNVDPNFNYCGMQEADGTLKHPDRTSWVDGVEIGGPSDPLGTKQVSNNIRFDDCTFNGSIVTQSPNEFTHVRNKLSFTGTTRFILESPLTDAEILVFRKSTLLAPHFSVEMGTFIAPDDIQETVKMSGTIVTGVLDMRGQVKIIGTLLTTFNPVSDTGPVLGETSPQFNTTLGYFSSASGDLESEIPVNGVGVIQIRYDPTLPLPDGILGHIDLTPNMATYREGGQ